MFIDIRKLIRLINESFFIDTHLQESSKDMIGFLDVGRGWKGKGGVGYEDVGRKMED